MSKRQWKPGQIVSAYIPSRSQRHKAVYIGGRDWPWRLLDSISDDKCDEIGLANVDDVRQLVVIDPEDREQVERLRDDHEFAMAEGMGSYDAMSWTLRQFAKDRPNEPTNDGALIECDYDGKHGRATLLGGSWTFYGDALRDHSAIYDDFYNVRVLSEGVVA